jgi:hypothetical protein
MENGPQDPHYLRHVVGLAAKQAVVTHTAVFSRSGIKLVESGVRIGDTLYDKLARHKLIPTIDECLSAEDPVTPASLQKAVLDMLAEKPLYAKLLAVGDAQRTLVRMMRALPLAGPLAFKLTVAREQWPELFRHSLKVASLATAIAIHAHMTDHEVLDALAAGLFHDLGQLHIDPELLRSTRPLQEAERRHLYSHPMLAHAILERAPEWRGNVATAVLEHHERLDGSGYPKGLHENRLGRLGQVIAIAELAATVLAQHEESSWFRLGIVLRMCEGKLNRAFCASLLEMLPVDRQSVDVEPLHRVLENLVELSVAFQRWKTIASELQALPLVQRIGTRMERLERSLADTGIDLEYWSAIAADGDFDPQSLGELSVAAREAQWQLRAIARETRLKWDSLISGSEVASEAVSGWLESIDALP